MPRQKDRTKPQHRFTPKRTPAQKEGDNVFIERLALEGYTVREIMAEIARTRPYTLSNIQIYNDLKAIRNEWREQANELITEHVAKMLKELNQQKKELWKAWRRSQKTFESRITRSTAEGTALEWRREERDGAVAFQNAISDINRQIRELFGLDKPKKTALTDVEGKESYQPLVLLNLSEADLPRAKKEDKE